MDVPFPDRAPASHQARWVALDLALGEAELARSLSRRFAATTHPALLEFLTDQLAALAASHRQTGMTLGLWVLLGDGGQLAPVATATLRLVAHDGEDLVGLVAAVADDAGLTLAPEALEPRSTETASGPATVLRCALTGPDEHELTVVCWPRSGSRLVAVLSSYGNDPVTGVADRLEELAGGIDSL